jgi:predicted ribosome quality control (RQC) complex YloA/Tae2 family protein
MKNSLTSVDVSFLAKELSVRLDGAYVDKAYQISRRELKLKFRLRSEGAAEVVIAPSYMCLSRYVRDAPERPTSFAMQLRKHLKGAVVRGIRQHGFDRIMELDAEKDSGRYALVIELFSKGNVILCDQQMRILGLLERQKWKDRTLSVGQIYAYPPAAADPRKVGEAELQKMLAGSGKSLAAALAMDAGFGGLYAEEVCRIAGLDKTTPASDLKEDELSRLSKSMQQLLTRVMDGGAEPSIILEDGKYVDAIPFMLGVYEKNEKKPYSSFNEAVDTYFSEGTFADRSREREDKLMERIEQLSATLEKQLQTKKVLEEKAEEYMKIGDLIYQNLQALEKTISAIAAEKKKGMSWAQIRPQLAGKKIGGVRFVDVGDDGSLLVEAEP